MINKTFNLLEEKNKVQTHTIVIPKLVELKEITVNTGKVKIDKINGEEVTITVSDGSYTRKVQTGGSYTPADTKYVTGQTSANYSSGGYTGTLERYLYSGSYTPSDSKTVTENRTIRASSTWKWTGSNWSKISGSNPGSPPNSISYSSRGYKGSLYHVEYIESMSSDAEELLRVAKGPGVDGSTIGETKSYNAHRVDKYSGTVTRPSSDTRVYRYRGDVTRPESDTRTYDYYYQYDINVKYTTNSSPEISGINTNMGDINKAFSYEYTVTDKDNDKLTIIETLNEEILNKYTDVATGTNKVIYITDSILKNLDVNKTNTLKISVDDGDITVERVITFKRVNTPPQIKLDNLILNKEYSINSKIEITGSVTDIDKDDFEIYYRVNDNNRVIVESDIKKDRKFTILLPLRELSDGDNEISVISIDENGFTSSKSLKLNMDKTTKKVNFGIRTYDLQPENEEVNGIILWIRKNSVDEVVVELSVNGKPFKKLQRNIINVLTKDGDYEDEYIYYEDKYMEDIKLRISTKDNLKINHINGVFTSNEI